MCSPRDWLEHFVRFRCPKHPEEFRKQSVCIPLEAVLLNTLCARWECSQHKVPTYWNIKTQHINPRRWCPELQGQRGPGEGDRGRCGEKGLGTKSWWALLWALSTAGTDWPPAVRVLPAPRRGWAHFIPGQEYEALFALFLSVLSSICSCGDSWGSTTRSLKPWKSMGSGPRFRLAVPGLGRSYLYLWLLLRFLFFKTPELPFRLARILMEFLDLTLVDNHFKYLHKLFIIKISLRFTYYYQFYRIGDIPLDSKYKMLLNLKIAFSK